MLPMSLLYRMHSCCNTVDDGEQELREGPVEDVRRVSGLAKHTVLDQGLATDLQELSEGSAGQ